MPSISDFVGRVKNAWNAFRNKDPTQPWNSGVAYSSRPDRVKFKYGAEKSIVGAIYNRIALDASAIGMQHVQLDNNGRYIKSIDSGLNNCLTVEANVDQTGRAFLQDVVMSLLDEGCVAIVPTDTSVNPKVSDSYNILKLRVGTVTEWYPKFVKVKLYNEMTARKEEIMLPKSMVALPENPMFAVMNETNSTMQRLIRKLALLDSIDEKVGAGKLDMIIQLPYVIKTEARKKQAEERRKDIETQLEGSKFGIAYTDGTEKVTQLNRPLENNLLKQVEYLTEQLFSQLGMTQEILNGTANEEAMLNYYSRTIEPILSAIADEMHRKFLTKNARGRMQAIKFYRDPFKLVSVNAISDIADRFTRNEIMTANEIRQVIGMKPSEDPNADILRNKNLQISDQEREQELQTLGQETQEVPPGEEMPQYE